MGRTHHKINIQIDKMGFTHPTSLKVSNIIKLNFYICDSFLQELKVAIEEYENIEAFSFKSSCKYQGIPHPFVNNNPKGISRYILGGCSIDATPLDEFTVLIKESSCFNLFAPKQLINNYIDNGAYLLTPGWLRDWEFIIQDVWGFDKKSAKNFFADFCKKLVLIDTMIEPNSKEHLEAFAKFVDIEYEIVPVGLDYFRLYVDNIIKSKTIESLDDSRQKYMVALQEKSNYAMAFDLLSRLNEKLDEKEIIDKIIEMFIMLFAPKDIIYFAISDNKIVKKLSSNNHLEDEITQLLSIKENYRAYQDSFLLKFIYNKKIVGFIRVEEVAFKEYLTPYLNLAISISGLCGLAIENARNHLKTKEAEAQLVQSSKLASMGEMMSSIAHQWRQPLNTLHLNIEMLEDYYEADKVDELFIEKFIEKNTATIQFLSQTISDFSNFFRVDKSKSHFKVKQNILEIISIVKIQLTNHNISYTIEGDDYEYFGLGNEFKQVILNLINNAKDAIIMSKIDDGVIDIKIIKEDDTISITVEDNGGGVDEKIIDRIFEPYFTTKDEGQGVGLGLYISKMIIEENMDGRLSVENSSRGAIFEIKLIKRGKDE